MSTTAVNTSYNIGEDHSVLPQHVPEHVPEASTTGADVKEKPVHRLISGTSSYSQEKGIPDPPTYVHRVDDDIEEAREKKAAFWRRYRPFILAGVAAVILGWWISSIVLKATRHRW